MSKIRKKHNPQDKVRIVLEVLNGELTMGQITAKYGVHASQISSWKKRAVEGLIDVFTGKKTPPRVKSNRAY
jgi:transposase